MYIRWILHQNNPIARKNIQYIFSLLNNKEIKYLEQGIYASLHTSKFGNITAEQLLTKLKSNDKNLESYLNVMFASLRGSKQYWNQVRTNLNVMGEKLGPATFFLTFSCAEYYWIDFLEFFKKMNPDLIINENMNYAELFLIDPVSATIYFENRWRSFLNNVLLSKDSPLGEITNYFWRIEYQVLFKFLMQII